MRRCVGYACQLILLCSSIKEATSLQEIPVPVSKYDRRLRVGPTDCKIVSCASTTELARAATYFINEGDTVVELGSGLDKVSASICQAVQGNQQNSENRAMLLTAPLGRKKKSGRNKDSIPEDFLGGGHYSDMCELLEMENGWVDYQTYVMGMGNVSSPSHKKVLVMDTSSILGNDLPLTTMSATLNLLQQEPAASSTVLLLHSSKLSSLARRLFHARRVHQIDQSTSVTTEGPSPVQRSEARSRQPIIVAGADVDEYRSTIPTLIHPGDHVLEIGCHGGYSTTLLHQAATADGKNDKGFCIGVDIGRKIIGRAKEAYPNIPFAVADGFNMLELLQVKAPLLKEYSISSNDESAKKALGYNVVFVDIGGLSGANGILDTLALVETISVSLQPRAIVVKSLCLQRLTGQLKAFSSIWNRDVSQ